MEKKSVYVMTCGEMCKIGVSKNPKRRLKEIQIGNPNAEIIYKSTPVFNAYEIECSLHKMYKENCIGREWFLIKNIQNVIDLIKEKIKVDGIFEIQKKNDSDKLCNEMFFTIIEKLEKESEKIEHEIQDMRKENERVQDFLYYISGMKNECDYANLIYRTIFGKSVKELEEEFGIGKTDHLRDCFTAEELKSIQSKEMLVSSLIDCGWGYASIKAFLEENCQNQMEKKG